MQHSHFLEKSGKISTQALERIHQENIPPTPAFYELWYIYYAQENPDVVHAIDVLVEAGEKLTVENCQEIYHRFLSDTTENERVREAGDKVQTTIKEMNGIVSNVKDATSKYNVTLTDMTDRLAQKGMTKEQIEAVVQDVMAGTRDMMKTNAVLEQELSRSSKVMKELQRDLEIVRKEALTDSLTKLANRKAFDAEITRIIAEAQQEGKMFSLLMMDIDHFKSFNDNYGHQVGDQVLRLVARTLTDGVKGRDTASRYGGEEFAIILPETDLPGGMKVGEYLRKAVAGKEVINRNTGDKLGRITLSGGVAQYMANESLESLIERADAALYTAKHNGRNQVAAATGKGQIRP